MTKYAKRKQPEHELQKAVVAHLRLALMPNVYYTAIPMGEWRGFSTGKRVKEMGAMPGAPDILLIVGGVPYGLELKAGAGKQSAAQVATEALWGAAGGVYAIARGIDDALDLLQSWGAIKGYEVQPLNVPFEGKWSR